MASEKSDDSEDRTASPPSDCPDAGPALMLEHLVRALADVRRETGTETIELRARFRTIEQRLAAIEEYQTRIMSLLEDSRPSPSAQPTGGRKGAKLDLTPEELASKRAAKRRARGAPRAGGGNEVPAKSGADTTKDSPGARAQRTPSRNTGAGSGSRPKGSGKKSA